MGDWTMLTVAKKRSKRESENEKMILGSQGAYLKRQSDSPLKRLNLTLSQGMLHMKTMR
jgi:hypothetical protein